MDLGVEWKRPRSRIAATIIMMSYLSPTMYSQQDHIAPEVWGAALLLKVEQTVLVFQVPLRAMRHPGLGPQ